MKLTPLKGRGNEYLFYRDDGEVIWTSRSKKGFPRLQQSLKTENPIEAREERDKLFASWFGEQKKIHKSVKPLNAMLWPEWAKTKDRKSQATKDSIHYSGQHILPMIEGLYADEITETWWENSYIPTKRAERPERKFFNEWKWLSMYLNYLHRQGAIVRLPRLENPDGETEPGICLSDSEIDALYEYAGPDLRLQIDLGLRHFMRRSEVLLMPYSEIDFEQSLINLPAERTKIRKARTIPVQDEVLADLMLRHEAVGTTWVWPSPQDLRKSVSRTGNRSAWDMTIRRANESTERINPKVTFHDLRHTGLTKAVAASNRYAEICKVAGLSFEQLERTYLHLKPDHYRFVSGLVGGRSGQ